MADQSQTYGGGFFAWVKEILASGHLVKISEPINFQTAKASRNCIFHETCEL